MAVSIPRAPLRIVRSTDRGPAGAPAGDFKSYLDRLVKMIPGEVVGLYLVGSGMIPSGERLGLATWTAVCLFAVVIVKAYGTGDPATRLPPDWVHVAISAISFVIWIYTMGGPFEAYGLAVPWIGSLLVLAWTFFIPLVYRGPTD